MLLQRGVYDHPPDPRPERPFAADLAPLLDRRREGFLHGVGGTLLVPYDGKRDTQEAAVLRSVDVFDLGEQHIGHLP